MIKILTLTALSFSFLFFCSVFADTGSPTDVTSQGFMVSLSNMDPLGA